VRILREICLSFGLCGLVWLIATPAHGQAPPPTLSSFLGIGADQQSSNPAIQAAAKAKAAKHQICKKKKALQYLAGMGCSPEHPEVGAALLAAMSDPDEPVRYEAVKAVLQTAGECQSPEQKKATRKSLGWCESLCDAKKKFEKKMCDCIDSLCGKAPPKEHKKLKDMLKREEDSACDPKADCPQGNGRGPCCSPDMRAKLTQLAYGRDDKGCFLEPSARVRDVAALALQACNACNGCGCDPMNGGFSGIRELPPLEERETGEYTGVFPQGSDLPGHCGVTDRAVPMYDQPAPAEEPTLAPAPEPVPTAPEPPPLEEIPTPAPACEPMLIPEGQALESVLRRNPDRFACLPPAWGSAVPFRGAVMPPRSPAGSVQSPRARLKPTILSWPSIDDALAAVSISEDWLAAEERLNVEAEFATMVGQPVAARLAIRPFISKRRPRPPAAPTPAATGAARPLPGPSQARAAAGGATAIIGGGSLLALILAFLASNRPKPWRAADVRVPASDRCPQKPGNSLQRGRRF